MLWSRVSVKHVNISQKSQKILAVLTGLYHSWPVLVNNFNTPEKSQYVEDFKSIVLSYYQIVLSRPPSQDLFFVRVK